jgi:hypothetical protein
MFWRMTYFFLSLPITTCAFNPGPIKILYPIERFFTFLKILKVSKTWENDFLQISTERYVVLVTKITVTCAVLKVVSLLWFNQLTKRAWCVADFWFWKWEVEAKKLRARTATTVETVFCTLLEIAGAAHLRERRAAESEYVYGLNSS